MISRRPAAILVALLCGSALLIDPTRAEPPTTQPKPSVVTELQRPIEQLLADLGSNDPARQDAARSELMLLEFREIDKLKTAATAQTLSASQVAALQEIVKQIFIAKELPTRGSGWGFMGVSMPIASDDDPRAGLPAVILGRVKGCDAYRVLREGDTVVGMQMMTPKNAPMAPIGSYRDLRAFLRKTSAGDWIVVRIIRNGEAVETALRLGLNSGDRQLDVTLFEYLADQYWSQQFANVIKPKSPESAEPAS